MYDTLQIFERSEKICSEYTLVYVQKASKSAFSHILHVYVHARTHGENGQKKIFPSGVRYPPSIFEHDFLCFLKIHQLGLIRLIYTLRTLSDTFSR